MTDAVLLDVTETLTPADHQKHRPYRFVVSAACQRISIHVRYAPKFLSPADSAPLVAGAIGAHQAALSPWVGEALARAWAADHNKGNGERTVANLLTISLDDSTGAYRGAGHRHANDQQLALGITEASPGLVAGPLPAGEWTLTISAHTVASAQCELSIQIGAETASSRP